MQIYFKTNAEMLPGVTSFLKAEGYKCSDDNKIPEGTVNTVDKVFVLLKFKNNSGGQLQIFSIKELERFIRIVKGEEIARFNSGKTEYTYIDFRLFEDMEDGVDNINDWHSNLSDYYWEIIYTLSAISFDDSVEFQLKRLQALSYQLSLLIQGITLNKIDATYNLRAFDSMAKVLMFGGEKYERNNWMKPSPNKLSAADSLYRHVLAMINGEMDDSDSGLPHIGHIMCNVMFLTYHLTLKEDGEVAKD